MSILQAIILSLVQGITEFLPVSSKGHLNLFQYLLGLQSSLSFDIFLNTATLFSVLIYFRSRLNVFIKNLPYIFIGTIPATVVGLVFKKTLEPIFTYPNLLPYFFLITTTFLFSTKFLKPQSKPLNYSRAFFIGLFQTAALLPGISRSGITIFSALLFGLNTIEAFEFSFCLFIPASIGALLLDAKNIFTNGNYLNTTYLLAFFLTLITGYFAIGFLKKIMTSQKLWIFSIYLIILSTLCFYYLRT